MLSEGIERSYEQETIADMAGFFVLVVDDKLVAVIAASADLGNTIRISVPLPLA
jgi:hypothetical protein